ncbi:uncharacterized protein LOC132314303 [Cornus florida]|uniref:uncharacterized protein LOC132314303 n=1 Tax=Cornus florida TaxID=4283 RepID=UPI00289EC84F|nr:uncharacterized protein LOC132314303 [Cornus florida]
MESQTSFAVGNRMKFPISDGFDIMNRVSLHVSVNSHVSSVPILNGTNFSQWNKQVQFNLGVLDLDLTFQIEKPIAITGESSEEEKSLHKVWEKSNRLSIMFMRMTITNNIKITLPKTDSAKEYLKNIEECFRIADKTLAGKSMANLTTIRFDGTRSMHEHVLDMTNLVAKLKTLG